MKLATFMKLRICNNSPLSEMRVALSPSPPLLTIELRRRRYIPLLEAGQDNTEQMTHQSSGREDAVWAVVVHCTMGLHCKAVKRNEGKGNGSSSSMAERGE